MAAGRELLLSIIYAGYQNFEETILQNPWLSQWWELEEGMLPENSTVVVGKCCGNITLYHTIIIPVVDEETEEHVGISTVPHLVLNSTW